MNVKRKFYFDQLELTVYPDSFLVQVGRIENPPRQDNIKEFPAWAFRSKNVIWFYQEEDSYKRRASHGDKVKQQLMQMLGQA